MREDETVVQAWQDYWECISCEGKGFVQSPSVGETDGPMRCYRCNGVGLTFDKAVIDRLAAKIK